MSPTVAIVAPPDPLSRGVSAHFRADGRDDQSGPLKYLWTETAGACPQDGSLPAQRMVLSSGTDATFDVSLDVSGEYCASVEVTDPQGAVGHDTHTFRVDDRPPSPSITQLGGPAAVSVTPPAIVSLFSDLHFSGRDSSDPDPGDGATGFSWSLTQPDGAVQRPPPACPGATADTCFTVVQSGTYVLALAAVDNEGTPATTTISIQVAEDRPPCIDETKPPFALDLPSQNPALALPLWVKGVLDDGDPLPAPLNRPSTRSFVWSWRVGRTGAFTRVVDFDLEQFVVPAGSFLSGQTAQFRVEAHDRVARAAEFLQCAQADPEPLACQAPAGCNRWVTWTVDFL